MRDICECVHFCNSCEYTYSEHEGFGAPKHPASFRAMQWRVVCVCVCVYVTGVCTQRHVVCVCIYVYELDGVCMLLGVCVYICHIFDTYVHTHTACRICIYGMWCVCVHMYMSSLDRVCMKQHVVCVCMYVYV